MPVKRTHQPKRKMKGKGIRDFFRGLKTGYDTVSTVGKVKKAYDDTSKKPIPPPLSPKPDHLRASKVLQSPPSSDITSSDNPLHKINSCVSSLYQSFSNC